MNFKQFLNEMPMRYTYEDDDSVIELNDDEENEYQYSKIKNENKIGNIDGFEIVKHKDGDYIYIDILDRKEERIIYRCKSYKGYTLEGISFTVSGAIWKKRDYKLDVVDFFYNHLLKAFGTDGIYSSASHTKAAEQYWSKLVSYGYKNGYEVGIIDFKHGTNKHHELKKVDSELEFKELNNKIYNDATVIAIYKGKK